LIGQSLGSLLLGHDALSLVVPDIFIDTMGYAFVLGLVKLLCPGVPTGAYVHYPTISTDMLSSLGTGNETHGLNAGRGAGAQGMAKKMYWELFAKLYSWIGGSVDVVMTNSSWTAGHIRSLWGPYRQSKTGDISVVYPPVAVEELEKEVPVDEGAEDKRQKAKSILYIAQFRPEKNHKLVLDAFNKFKKSDSLASHDAKLVLVGSVRDDGDAKRVYELRLRCNELGVKDSVTFLLDASWPQVLDCLREASVGVNGMWNEHFGIGVVEYQAAGLICVVHDSGGPKIDIVTPVEGRPTGYHASTAGEFAEGFGKALSMSREDTLDMRRRAQISAKRFGEDEFAKGWLEAVEKLVALRISGAAEGRANEEGGVYVE
jgi:alpha-1,2-mannosyltransferase